MLTKKKQAKTVTRQMWAIVDSRFYPMCLSYQRKYAIKDFIGDQSLEYAKPWSYWRSRGCRAVKVQVIVEVPNAD